MALTRRQAFNKICAENLLPRSQMLVYVRLFKHGPKTGTQLDMALQQLQGTYGCYHKRVGDLEKRGLVERLPNPRGRGTLWQIIDGAMPGPMPAQPKEDSRPTRDELKIAAAVIRDLKREAMRNKGVDLGSRGAAFEKTVRWIANGARYR